MIGNLHYICISRGSTILAEYSENTKGSFRTQMPEILGKIQPNRTELLNSGEFRFYLKSTQQHIFTIITSFEYPRRIAYDAVKQISELFMKKFTEQQRNTSIANSLDREMQRDLKEKFDFYNSNKCDKILEVRQNVDDLKDVIERDMQKLLDRGQNIDVIVVKSKNMKEVSTQMYKQSQAVHRKMWWQNKKITLIIILIVLVAIWLLTSFICGFSYDKC